MSTNLSRLVKKKSKCSVAITVIKKTEYTPKEVFKRLNFVWKIFSRPPGGANGGVSSLLHLLFHFYRNTQV